MVSFLNAHAADLAWTSEPFRQQLLDADFLLRDGIGASLAMRSAGIEPGLNMNGTDFIPSLIDRVGSQGLALFGTASPWLDNATRALQRNGNRILVSHHGYDAYDTSTWT